MRSVSAAAAYLADCVGRVDSAAESRDATIGCLIVDSRANPICEGADGCWLARLESCDRPCDTNERAGLLRRLRADGWLNEGEPEEKSRADDRASDCDDAPKNGERLGLDGEEPAWPSPAALCKPLGEGVVPLK